jgi:phosphatidylserine decarboxylase
MSTSASPTAQPGSGPLPELAVPGVIRSWAQHERLNFLLTNRIPRRLLTRVIGWYSTIESPALTRWSIAVWRLFDSDLDFGESSQREFTSLRACFIRTLKDGARPVDARPDVAVSPCDAIVGACGRVEGTRVFQAKGFPYELGDLIPDAALQSTLRDGSYVTLRLTPSMYHRFHAPVDCRVEEVTYISGDTWNVNPIALQRIEKLFCKNERAVVELKLGPAGSAGDGPGRRHRRIALVPVAAILVASMQFNCLPEPLDLRYRGPHRIACSAAYRRGEEMGYFQQGSTIIVFADAGYRLADGVTTGTRVAMGQALLVDEG